MLFQATDGFYGAGVLRFTRPDRAWLLDASGYAALSDATGGRNARGGSVLARAGQRRFAPVVPRVVRSTTYGLVTEYEFWNVDSSELVSRQFAGRIGLFADVGAQWLVTPNFAMGGSLQAALSGRYGYQRARASDGSGGMEERKFAARTLTLALGTAQAFVALYF